MNKPLLEVCVDSYASAIAAIQGGADRLELCANLAIGGTIPSHALFRQVRRDCGVPINVLIRPRFGDFLYTPAELEEMVEEIQSFRELGANGIVTGVLTPEGKVDAVRMAWLIDRAGEMEVTLHRAFDMTRDPFAALETAVELGCKTILTSGQEHSAVAGKELLRELFLRAGGRIDLMAGAGINKENILELYNHTGIRVFHASARRGALDSGMIYRKETVSMGLPSLSEYEIWQTSEEEVRACAQIIKQKIS